MVEEECFSHILFPSDKCDYESSNKEYLTIHETNSHRKPDCNDCDYKTNLTRYLGTHGVGCHGFENVRIKCFACEFETKSPRESKHTQKISYNCNLCAYNY